MKIRNKILISIFFLGIALVLSNTCLGVEDGGTKEVVKGEYISISANEISDGYDDIKKCKITSIGGSRVISKNVRDSADPDYVEIKGKKVGTTTIEITAENKDEGDESSITKKFTINVIEAENKEVKTVNLNVGEKYKIRACDLNESSEDIKTSSSKTYSDNPKIAYIDTNDTNRVGMDYVLVVGKSKGETHIYITVELQAGGGKQIEYEMIINVIDGSTEDETRDNTTFEDILDKIDDYDKPSDLDSATSTKIEKAASKVLTAITNVGIVASIIIIAVLGIKYMLGSVEEKAEFKKDMIPYLIGAFLLFGITAFVKIFMQWGKMISNL